MSNHGYFKAAGQAFGPCTPTQLQRLAAEGTIKPTTLVRRGEDGKWVEAGKVKGLFSPIGDGDVGLKIQAKATTDGDMAPFQKLNDVPDEIAATYAEPHSVISDLPTGSDQINTEQSRLRTALGNSRLFSTLVRTNWRTCVACCVVFSILATTFFWTLQRVTKKDKIRKEVAFFLKEARANAKAMTLRPTVSEATEKQSQLKDLYAHLPELSPDIDPGGVASNALFVILSTHNTSITYAKMLEESKSQETTDLCFKGFAELADFIKTSSTLVESRLGISK